MVLNKLSIDRFNPVGPLHPQNHQLIDISNDKMQLLYDMPLPLGEPHYVVGIQADKLAGRALQGRHQQPHRPAARRQFGAPGEEKTVREGNQVIVYGTLIRSHITRRPSRSNRATRSPST